MANYHYKAVDSFKELYEGSVSAKSREEVAQLLSKRNLKPISVKEAVDQIRIHGTIPPIDKITFCRYLSIMLSTGLSLSEGIDVLREETKHPLMKRVLGDMTYSLEQGQQLSSIFERYPDIFEPYFIILTRAGEVSGKLADVFRYLEMELRAEYSLNAKVKGALLYPAVVFVAMLIIGVLMFFFVLPQIGKVFLSLNLPLPAITQGLFRFSIAMSKQIVPIVVGAILTVLIAIVSFRSRSVRHMGFYLIRPIPMIRDLIIKIDLARFNRIFSTLIRSAVPIIEALEISLKSLSWYEFHKIATVLPEEIKKGKTLAKTVKNHKIFPGLMVQMISAGEKTATLDATLADLASFYEQEIEEEVKSLTQIIEPVLMLLVGVAVGGMILSIIAPIYSVVGSFQQAAGGQPR